MIPARTVRLTDGKVDVDVDLGRGAEITALTDLRTSTSMLFRTPWAERALTSRPVTLAADPATSEEHWTATYAGGWQTLFPHAGEPREVDGRMRHYHGEASSVPWALDAVDDREVHASVRLHTADVAIQRTVRVEEGSVTVKDRIVNLSAGEIGYDYQAHPAFGAPFLEEGCTIAVDAASYTPDPRLPLDELEAGATVAWPLARGSRGLVDLAVVPAAGSRVFRFGWLDGLRHPRFTIANHRLDLAATMEWLDFGRDRGDAGRDRVWLWLDAGLRDSPPWDGRGYALALEPSTRTTVGAEPQPRLRAGGSVTYATTLTVHPAHRGDVSEGDFTMPKHEQESGT